MISEFYRLRRTAIKDVVAYLSFLVGFIGSAPFAWGLLAVQLEDGRFARGLWYFFGIVTAAGIFAGVAGLGAGVALGIIWEQVHRYRRRSRASEEGGARPDVREEQASDSEDVERRSPRLRLVVPEPPIPSLLGKTLRSVRFAAYSIELEVGAAPLTISAAAVEQGGQRFEYPRAASRDALCGLIGQRVVNVRSSSGNQLELEMERGSQLLIPRADINTTAVASRANET